VNTETTEHAKGWVFYDAECAICRRWADRSHDTLVRHGFHLVPLQSPLAALRLGIRPGAVVTEMKVGTPCGEILDGGDAMVYLARLFWWGFPLHIFGKLPMTRHFLCRVYEWFAQRRHCLKGGA
jgi:predicted DCC family thiol-disulfide oxidoreductase YuxK